jgi:hypothetical protein
MKKWRVEKVAVVKMAQVVSANDEAGAVKAFQEQEDDLEEMDLEFILSLDELGISVIEQKAKKPKKSKTK